MFHYSPAVLYETLPEIYYQHHLLLVEGIFLLLQDSVCDSDVQQTSRLLQHYVFMFASLYGEFACYYYCLLWGKLELELRAAIYT